LSSFQQQISLSLSTRARRVGVAYRDVVLFRSAYVEQGTLLKLSTTVTAFVVERVTHPIVRYLANPTMGRC